MIAYNPLKYIQRFAVNAPILLCLLFFSSQLFGQKLYKRPKPKNSYGQGTLDFYWGYNRSAYSSSTIRFVGDEYDLRLHGVNAKDNQSPFSGKYFSPTRFTVPQYNIRLGYNFKNFWNVSIGFDKMKYVIRDAQSVRISGYVETGVDPEWSGTFNNGQQRVLNESHFQYQNSGGLNYVRVQVSRNLAPFRKLRNGDFSFNWMYGVSAGAIVSFTDYTFEGYRTERVSSISGYGISIHNGARLVFFKHLFLQANVAGGLVHQVRARTRPGLGNYASQVMTYGAIEGAIGFLMYIRPTNDCNSCPRW